MRRFFIFLVLIVFAAPGLATSKEWAEDLPARPGVKQRVLFIEPPGKPVASAILFTGGKGKIGLRKDGTIKRGGNFLVKTRNIFASHDLLVAVVDAPSDEKDHDGMSGHRKTAAHARDIAAVIKRLRELTPVPVWLIGTSRGTISAANGAARLSGREGPDGIVLTSSVVATGNRMQDSVFDVDVEDIRVPALVVHHKDDSCYVTLWRDADSLPKELVNSPKTELMTITGGDGGEVDAECGPKSHHGFLDQREPVIERIADWIKAIKP
ncbi:MAG: alpha/beta hydrolase [Alphaproteobacteria bacterium]|jgi:hypothetical protein|nr:alpha/beta hydrolase [Alphaproteobacteria bacterium]|tara:strand:+ start:1050 stop:1850 length:801 start_codon:yes stop_codon:yes gene_type:complete